MKRRMVGGLCVLALTFGLGVDLASGQCVEDEDCNDFNACTYDECIATVCSNTPRLYGDVNGDGTPNVFDIFCILDLIAGVPVGPECDLVNANIEPCVPNEALNVFDIFAVLNMIAGGIGYGQRLWAVRHGGQPVGVVPPLVRLGLLQ